MCTALKFCDREMITSDFYAISVLSDSSFDEKFEFYPNGAVGQQFCGDTTESTQITWLPSNISHRDRSITTRQIILSSGFMIQFKVCVTVFHYLAVDIR